MSKSYLQPSTRFHVDSTSFSLFTVAALLITIIVTVADTRRKTRDDLSHHIFLMLQECNKFREHQARENLIALMEKQIAERRNLVQELSECTSKANELLNLQYGDDMMRTDEKEVSGAKADASVQMDDVVGEDVTMDET
jgi:MED7 protein